MHFEQNMCILSIFFYIKKHKTHQKTIQKMWSKNN